MALKVAGDGQPARVIRPWTHEKLFYIERYLDIFCTAMRGKWSLVYADLLAGPGLCVEQEAGSEVKGSALLAIDRPEFVRVFLNDRDAIATAALASRTTGVSSSRLAISTTDCNLAVDAARNFLFPKASRAQTLGLAVIDPTAFQMSYDSMSRLTDSVRLDLIVIYMSSYVRRFLAQSEFGGTLDRFYGTDAWRSFIQRRASGERISYGALLDLYQKQLEKLGYNYQNAEARTINTRDRTVYHIIFASRHPLGADFFQKISRISYGGQRKLM